VNSTQASSPQPEKLASPTDTNLSASSAVVSLFSLVSFQRLEKIILKCRRNLGHISGKWCDRSDLGLFWSNELMECCKDLLAEVLYINVLVAFSALTLLVGRQEGHPVCKKWDGGGGYWLVWMEWQPASDPGKRAVKWLWWWWYFTLIVVLLGAICQNIDSNVFGIVLPRMMWVQCWHGTSRNKTTKAVGAKQSLGLGQNLLGKKMNRCVCWSDHIDFVYHIWRLRLIRLSFSGHHLHTKWPLWAPEL